MSADIQLSCLIFGTCLQYIQHNDIQRKDTKLNCVESNDFMLSVFYAYAESYNKVLNAEGHIWCYLLSLNVAKQV